MNYEMLYHRLIENRRQHPVSPGIYSERHHIVPRCEGGSDAAENLIRLTARDHLFAHLILAKWKGGVHWASVAYVFTSIARSNRLPTAQEVRIAAKAREFNPMQGRSGFKCPSYGLVRSPETRAKMARARRGSGNGMFGKVGSAHPMFDPTIFTLRHRDGRIEQGTTFELTTRLGLARPNFSNLKKKPRSNQVQGWSIVDG